MCDLASFASIRNCAEEFQKRYSRLDVLVNNAGVLLQERQESGDGIELNLAVNFLAPFLLTNLLIPVLKSGAPSRIVNVSSSMHKEGKINFTDLESKKSFDKYTAYAQSKLALILFTKKLARDLKESGVTVNVLNPGIAGTELEGIAFTVNESNQRATVVTAATSMANKGYVSNGACWITKKPSQC